MRQPFPPIQSFFFVRYESRNKKIRFSDIAYIEACKNYCKINTAGQSYMTLAPIKRLEEFLPATDFCRIHRSFIVSFDWLQAFDTKNAYGPDRILPIGEAYRPVLLRRVQVLMGVGTSIKPDQPSR